MIWGDVEETWCSVGTLGGSSLGFELFAVVRSCSYCVVDFVVDFVVEDEEATYESPTHCALEPACVSLQVRRAVP